MINVEFPQIKLNGIYYYINQRIIVSRIFKELHMAKVRFIDSEKEFIIDMSVLSFEPSKEVSISIKLLGVE